MKDSKGEDSILEDSKGEGRRIEGKGSKEEKGRKVWER